MSLAEHSVRTPREVQTWFRENGLTVAAWSKERSFSPALVYAVVRGQRKCLRGESHRIAVALGLKPEPATQ
jgi:gp16 family phage-associated protein